MRVLLVAPHYEDPQYPLYMPSENLGLGYLAAFLRNNGVSTEILDANMLQINARDIATSASISEFDVVGISASSHMLIWEAKRIANVIKSVKRSIHITVGGHFCTFRDQEILADDANIDSVVRGDGESTLLELVQRLRDGKTLDGLEGLTYRTNRRNIEANVDRPVVQNLDELPFPARDTLKYLKNLGHSWPTQMTSSRGCYASCAFCDIRAFYGPNWRARSAANVVDEIQYLVEEFGVRLIRFTDDEFLGPKRGGPERARSIADELIKRKVEVELMIDARAHAVEEALFTRLREAGVIDCLIGVESGVDRILKLYNKGSGVSHNRKAIEILRRCNISLNLAFIMFDPRMSFAELIENYNFLEEMEITTVDSLKSWLWPLHGTPAIDEIRKAGLVLEERLDGVTYRFADPAVESVFNKVSLCKEKTFALERQIFFARIHHPNSQALHKAELSNLALWRGLFRDILENAQWDDITMVETEAQIISYQLQSGVLT